MKQKVKSNFEEKMEQNLKKCYEKKIEKYKKEHEKEIEHVKSIEKQYDKDLIDYDALFKSLTKWA
ncbi:hypothetical protein [Romboutsia timonensis]|jgi:hypothetical protein|uniref:hypothetical protein n=1 Tax=Romboutsia timonensis TaxID=1776391 RepID=UPI00204A17AF|nr:MAG TPA: hypothetical protein [Caudoviricetes sp.]